MPAKSAPELTNRTRTVPQPLKHLQRPNLKSPTEDTHGALEKRALLSTDEFELTAAVQGTCQMPPGWYVTDPELGPGSTQLELVCIIRMSRLPVSISQTL